jgi:hypothetical protein
LNIIRLQIRHSVHLSTELKNDAVIIIASTSKISQLSMQNCFQIKTKNLLFVKYIQETSISHHITHLWRITIRQPVISSFLFSCSSFSFSSVCVAIYTHVYMLFSQSIDSRASLPVTTFPSDQRWSCSVRQKHCISGNATADHYCHFNIYARKAMLNRITSMYQK